MTCEPTTKFDRIAGELEAAGWSVWPEFLAPQDVGPLREQLRKWWQEGEFRRAAVGRGPSRRIDDEIRGDQVRWVDFAQDAPFRELNTSAWEPLRLAINRRLMLGLIEIEGHVTVYPPGTHYARHLDRFRDASHRTLSLILYLSEDWTPDDGGQLRLYLPRPDGTEKVHDVLPQAGTLVTFLSETFSHEVLPSRGERLSFTSWFCTRR